MQTVRPTRALTLAVLLSMTSSTIALAEIILPAADRFMAGQTAEQAGSGGLTADTANTALRRPWGLLADLAGREWAGDGGHHRFIWSDNGRTLSWQQASQDGAWHDWYVFNQTDSGVAVRLATGRSRGTVSVEASGATVARVGSLGATTRFVRNGDGFDVIFRPIPITWRLTPQPGGWTGQSLEQASTPAPAAGSGGPIVLAQVVAPAGGSAPVNRAPQSPAGTASAGSGPIILAAAPPPAAAQRLAQRPAQDNQSTPAPSSREALMAAQVTARRRQAAVEAEAERLRQAQAAEAARIAEENRRAAEQSRSSGWGEAFAFVGAIAGGVAAGVGSGGDMTAISAGMAAGSAIAAPNSEIAAASNSNFQVERERYEEERAFEQRVIAELNNPDNPLTQEARRRDEAREAASKAEAERIQTEDRQRREEADREALLSQRTAEAEQNRQESAAQGEREAAQEAERAQQQRREAERRERAAEQAREADEQRQNEERQRREQAQREADAHRQEQERQRAAAEAERTRVIDFREAVVLCSLSGPQAQFNNWTCQGPLQMNYINFERGDVTSAMRLVDCANARELPRAGSYRAFGCGYGIHPTNPGALRNVPEMLGVFVDGRATFRCPRNISGVCRTQ